MSAQTRRTPGLGPRGLSSRLDAADSAKGTTRPAQIQLAGSAEDVATELVDIVGPNGAREVADAVYRQAGRVDRLRRHPYIGPSCDHRAGPGWVWEQTQAERERTGVRR